MRVVSEISTKDKGATQIHAHSSDSKDMRLLSGATLALRVLSRVRVYFTCARLFYLLLKSETILRAITICENWPVGSASP